MSTETRTDALEADASTLDRPAQDARQGVSPRAVVIGLACALGICALTPYNDYYIAATYLSGNFFPIGALGAILVLILAVNPLLIAVGKRDKTFRTTEIITVWSLIIVAVGIPSSGLMRYLIPHVIAAPYYASASNGWNGLIVSHLPDRLIIKDPYAYNRFFEGLHRGESIPWGVWGGPLFWWGLFVALLYTAFFCLSSLVRKQWVENERFTFPLVRLPLLLAEAPEPGQKFNGLVRSWPLWLGVGLTTALHLTKGMHLFYPTIPDVTTSIHSSDYFTERPWNGLNDINLAVYPLIIGISYLMSSEVCVSLWLFYLIFKLQTMFGSLYAWDMSGAGTGWAMGPAFVSYEEAGGAVMLTLWTLWSARLHLREVWRKAVHNDPTVDDAAEALPYRFALFGLIGAYAGMFAWLTVAAGIQPLLAGGVLVGSLIVFVLLSWLVAQAGLLFIQQAYSPAQLTTVLFGTMPFDARSLAMSSITEHVGWQDAREFMMPPLLNSMKASAETGLNARSLLRSMALCVVLATVVSAVVSIWLPYTHGGGTSIHNRWTYVDAPQLSLSWTAAQVQNPKPPNLGGILQMAGGAVFTLLVFVCRSSIPGFSLHPAGFLVAATYPMYMMWFSLFLGWLLKGPIVRYGGMRGYRLALPFFLGLVLGDCLNAIGWVVIGLITHTGYSLLPG